MMRRKSKGFTLVATIFILIVVLMIALTSATLLTSESGAAADSQFSLKAFYIAEAGAEYFNKQLAADSSWATPPAAGTATFSGGSFTTSIISSSASAVTFNSVGNFSAGGKTYARSLYYTVLQGAWAFTNTYVLYWGTGVAAGTGTAVGNNATIIGSILTNDNLTLGSGVNVSGDVQSAGTVGGNTSGVTGTVSSNVALPLSPPNLDTTPYNQKLTYASTMGATTGNSWSGTQVKNGYYYYKGNLTVAGNLTTTSVLTVCAVGTIAFSGNAIVGNNITFIAGGVVTLNNGVTIGGRCMLYSNTIVGSSFVLGNNVTVGVNSPGMGSTIVTPGGISTFGNNDIIYGLIFAGNLSLSNNVKFYGNILAGHVSAISNNCVLNLQPSLNDFYNIVGVSGGTYSSVTAWGEIY